MSILAKVTVTPLLYLAGALALLSLGLGIALKVRASDLAAAEAKVELVEGWLAGCREANETNVGTIRRLEHANNAWAAACRMVPGEQDAAVAALRAENERLASALVAARNNREVVYERSPDARAWADAPVPADVADQLWPR